MTIDEAIAEIERLSDENANLDAACKMQDRENERLRALNAEMREALEQTVKTLDSSELQGIVTFCYTHGYHYAGPTVDMAGLRALLLKSESPTPEKES